ncbi:MAG: hypothetical protein RJA17_1548 [Pseudomonadota bacterium]|jgi:cell division protein FtsL
MTGRILLLGILLVASALSLVHARYQERRLYAQMERLDRLGQQLQSDIETLAVQRAALGVPARIDGLVRDRLGMVPIRPADTSEFRPQGVR